MTRQEYLSAHEGQSDWRDAQANAHRAYYAQFVQQSHKWAVANRFGAYTLAEAAQSDRHLNNVGSLHTWDMLAQAYVRGAETAAALKAAGDYLTLSGKVCILKEAALQVAENPAAYGKQS